MNAKITDDALMVKAPNVNHELSLSVLVVELDACSCCFVILAVYGKHPCSKHFQIRIKAHLPQLFVRNCNCLSPEFTWVAVRRVG